MHRSLRFLANVFMAVLSFLMLGNITSAVSLPEQRLIAKRKPTSTTGNVYQARQYNPARRRRFVSPDAFLADSPDCPSQ